MTEHIEPSELKDDSESTTQLNIEVPKDLKKQFARLCVEQEWTLKNAAEIALLDFIEKYENKAE